MDKQQLYNLVFEDGEQYTNFYFEQRRNKISTYCTKCGDNVLALANYVDINVYGNGKSYKAALISGVCTFPDMRGKGIMKNLLSNLINTLKTKNYDLAILSPINDDYYKKFSFESLVKGDLKQINHIASNEFSLKKATKIDIKLLLELYESISEQSTFAQTLSEDIALDLVDEFAMDNCSIQFVCQNQKPIGWITTDGKKVENAIMPDLNMLNNIRELDGYFYFEPNPNGKKDLFQIKYLNENVCKIELNTALILNKY